MVARSARVGGYSPAELPRVSVAADGTLAAIHESSRVTILEIPSGVAFAEVGADPDALASEVAWVAGPPRLLVLSRYAAHSTVHLLDPYGPRTIAEIRLEAPMRLYATVGNAALVIGSIGAAVLVANESSLAPYQFPARAVPVTAGAAASQFVVALAGSIEEWDPQTRLPKRRLRLPRSAAITAVGGSERVVWMTTQQEPARIDVIPLVNRGQPKAHDLPEPIARIASHPRSDLVACVGADTGRLYVIDLDGRTRQRVIAPEGIDRIESVGLLVGRMVGVLAAQAGHPIAIVALDGRDAREVDGEPAATVAPALRSEPARRSALDDAGPAGSETHEPRADAGASSHAVPAAPPQPAASQPAGPPAAPGALLAGIAKLASPSAPVDSLFRHPAAQPSPASRAAPPSGKQTSSVSERFSAWRDAVRQNQTRVAPASGSQPDLATLRADAVPSWRDEVVAWSRTATAPGHGAPAVPSIDALLARFDLAPELQPVLVWLYGAHLCGEPGAAPVDLARLLDGQWDEALGRGDLALHGVARYAGSRVALSPVVLRVLDELPPTTGTLVGEPASVALLGPCVVVAGDEPLTAVAARCVPHVGGAILVARDDADLADLLFEARAHGAAPMLRVAATVETAPNVPAIFAVDDAELADRLGLPLLA